MIKWFLNFLNNRVRSDAESAMQDAVIFGNGLWKVEIDERQYFRDLNGRNPFYKPDYDQLVKEGYFEKHCDSPSVTKEEKE